MGAKICKKGTFKRLFLTKFEFSVLIFRKIVKMPPLWVQVNPGGRGTQFIVCKLPTAYFDAETNP